MPPDPGDPIVEGEVPNHDVLGHEAGIMERPVILGWLQLHPEQSAEVSRVDPFLEPPGQPGVATGGMKAQAAKAFWRYLKNAGDDRVQQSLVQAIFDPEYAYMIERGAKGFIDPKQLEAMVGNKIIRLEDYKRQAMRQTAIGTEAAASGNE